MEIIPPQLIFLAIPKIRRRKQVFCCLPGLSDDRALQVNPPVAIVGSS